MGFRERLVDRVAGGVLARKRAVVGLKRARDSEDTFRDAFYRFPRKSKPWTTCAADATMNVFVETSPKGTEEAKQRLQDAEAIVCSPTVEPAVEEDDDATADDLNQETCHISPQQPTEGRPRLKSRRRKDAHDSVAHTRVASCRRLRCRAKLRCRRSRISPRQFRRRTPRAPKHRLEIRLETFVCLRKIDTRHLLAATFVARCVT